MVALKATLVFKLIVLKRPFPLKLPSTVIAGMYADTSTMSFSFVMSDLILCAADKVNLIIETLMFSSNV